MDEQARALAQELLNAGQTEFVNTYPLSNSDEVIVVYAVRTNRPRGEKLVKASRTITEAKAVAGSMGIQCPACGGSGRI